MLSKRNKLCYQLSFCLHNVDSFHFFVRSKGFISLSSGCRAKRVIKSFVRGRCSRLTFSQCSDCLTACWLIEEIYSNRAVWGYYFLLVIQFRSLEFHCIHVFFFFPFFVLCSAADCSRLRLAAACAIIKIAQEPNCIEFITLEVFQKLSLVMQVLRFCGKFTAQEDDSAAFMENHIFNHVLNDRFLSQKVGSLGLSCRFTIKGRNLIFRWRSCQVINHLFIYIYRTHVMRCETSLQKNCTKLKIYWNFRWSILEYLHLPLQNLSRTEGTR